MQKRVGLQKLLCVLTALAGLWSSLSACAADDDAATSPPSSAAKTKKAAKPKLAGTVAGIYIDKKDDWILVRVDGEEEPVKYVIDPTDKKLQAAFKAIFNACRVKLMYKTEGDTRKLVGIQRQVLVETGVVTGEVVKVWNNFWVEVKPKGGLADGYAPGAQWNDKAFMEALCALQPGDSVTISFNTDFERHRIVEIRKNPNPPSRSKKGSPPRAKSPAKS